MGANRLKVDEETQLLTVKNHEGIERRRVWIPKKQANRIISAHHSLPLFGHSEGTGLTQGSGSISSGRAWKRMFELLSELVEPVFKGEAEKNEEHRWGTPTKGTSRWDPWWWIL